jgi:hypothetical protein
MEYGRELIGSIVVASEGNLVKENIFLISKLGKTFRYIFILQSIKHVSRRIFETWGFLSNLLHPSHADLTALWHEPWTNT